jgi:hypothetical protein
LDSSYHAEAQEAALKWESTILKFEKSDQETPPPEGVNLFVGSSSIVMLDVVRLFPEYKVLNRGFGGSQFSDLLYYVNRVVTPYKPAKIFIYEGDNDIFLGENPKNILKEAKKVRKIIAKKLPGVPVVFISAKPSVARWKLKEQYESFNRGLKKYAKRRNLPSMRMCGHLCSIRSGNVLTHIFREDGFI